VPAGDAVIGDQFASGVPNFHEFLFTTVNLAGESQNFDGNGPFVRFQPGGGPVKIRMANPAGGPNGTSLTGFSIAPPLGSQPVLGAKPPLRSNVACYRNPIPDFTGAAGQVGPPSPAEIP
jgi:phospholipid/cholesterol/gamma-HCH transport system substrate-binding protein